MRPQPAPSTQKVLLPGISHTGATRLREFWDKCSYIQKCAPHRCCSAMKSTSMLFVIIPYSVRWCKLSCRKVRTEQVKFTLSQGQSAILAVYRQGVALGIAALNDGLGDQGLHAALDEPLDGTCAIDAVVSRIDDEVLGSGPWTSRTRSSSSPPIWAATSS